MHTITFGSGKMWVFWAHILPGLIMLWWLPVYTGRMYALTPVYTLSRIFNCVTGGKCSWTFSARVGEAVVMKRSPVRAWCGAESGINWFFQDPNHCVDQAVQFGAHITPDSDPHEFETNYSFVSRLKK